MKVRANPNPNPYPYPSPNPSPNPNPNPNPNQVLDKCIAAHKEGPTQRNLAGFLPYQLALEQGPSHRAQAGLSLALALTMLP